MIWSARARTWSNSKARRAISGERSRLPASAFERLLASVPRSAATGRTPRTSVRRAKRGRILASPPSFRTGNLPRSIVQLILISYAVWHDHANRGQPKADIILEIISPASTYLLLITPRRRFFLLSQTRAVESRRWRAEGRCGLMQHL